MKAADLKIGLKLKLKFRATITGARIRNNQRDVVTREVSKITNYGDRVDYIEFKGMKTEFRLSSQENFYLYAITGNTREYLIIE